ncbi:MAG: CDP-glycerol glycerophosphotransferase family protein, partial [Coprococcus sp.]
AVIKNHIIKQKIECESHFSKLSQAFPHSYWFFGRKTKWLGQVNAYSVTFKPSNHLEHAVYEIILWVEMLFKRDIRSKRFLLLRMAYFACKPFLKRRPVWMYMDKIYKGADSSEYLYRYAVSQPEDIKHYYLIDKKSADYHRIINDGYQPLVRGSFKHRLIFLYADMLIASNSTVCPFNDYGLPNSSYVRDLFNFNVCCVQHGMSVQRIAIAQNRLKDNTKLYFCASKYEIQNLSKPVYDYVGYDALKLTGVPRYDGLVDRHKKQIMISPTWRMQSAVPVKTSEGHQREYNPLFKESAYYKIYNSLINDSRLIEAAKCYGYKIKYVLHPIVSAQAKDFDKNDCVDIVPSVGDMSYEEIFCESALMVTDFSGVQFDFAYMRKPVVYLHHEDVPPHYEEGAFFYDTMGFGEICHNNDELIDLLCQYMKDGCVMKEKYIKRADDFFEFEDHKNCERIYNEMIGYQNRIINRM